MTKLELLDNPNHPDYVPPQYGPGEWTIDDFTGPEDDEGEYWFSAELVTVSMAFFGQCVRELHPDYQMMDHNEVAKLLIEAGVCTAEEAEPESGCFYVYYKTREQAQGFIDRFNAYLQHLLDTEPKVRAFHEKLCELRAEWVASIEKQAQA